MGSGSFRREEDKTAFESLQAAADQPLINFPVDDVTSRAPATTKGVCVLPKKYCISGCVFGSVHLACVCTRDSYFVDVVRLQVANPIEFILFKGS